MKITYVGRKIDVTDSLKKWAEKKLSKLDKFFEDDADVKLTIGRQRGRFALECTIRTKNTIFRVEEIDNDAYVAIDHIVPAIERQIRKHKTRLMRRLREGAFDQFDAIEPSYAEEEEKEFKIVKKKRVDTKPMSLLLWYIKEKKSIMVLLS
jgi:putative sigma-54 modulation protein